MIFDMIRYDLVCRYNTVTTTTTTTTTSTTSTANNNNDNTQLLLIIIMMIMIIVIIQMICSQRCAPRPGTHPNPGYGILGAPSLQAYMSLL